MRYQIAVYFYGQISTWQEKLHPNECVFIGQAPWLWLARIIANSHMGNTGRCSYVITRGEEVIEHAAHTTQPEPS